MGTDINVILQIGFKFKAKEFDKFKRTIQEESHQEDRFDPKTGKFSHSEKVIDIEKHEIYYFDGYEFERLGDPYEQNDEKSGLLNYICYKIHDCDFTFTEYNDDDNFEVEEWDVIIHPILRNRNHADAGHLNFTESIFIEECNFLQNDLRDIRSGLDEMGLENMWERKPAIYNCLSYS